MVTARSKPAPDNSSERRLSTTLTLISRSDFPS
jgi:hypothetical protein